jgi:sRNA-binding carbon storage regulator CsrA
MTTLYRDMDVGESIEIGDIIVTIEEKTGRKVRLKVEADRSVPIKGIKPKGQLRRAL